MIGWMVTSASASGWRRMCSRPRRATTHASPNEVARGARRGRRRRATLIGSPPGPRPAPTRTAGRRSGSGTRRRASAGAARGRRPRCRRRPARRPGARRRAGRRSVGACTERAAASIAGVGAGDPLHAARPPSPSRAGVDDGDEELGAADLALELAGVAAGDDPAVVDDHDVVGQAVGLLEVLGGEQDGRALGRRACRARPTARCGRAGRGRWSARRGTAPRGGPPAWRPGRGGAACRRSRSWPGGRPASARSNCSSSSSARARATPRPRWWSSPIMARFSRPVSRLVDRRVLRGEAEHAAHGARVGGARRCRRRWRVPASGLGQRGEDAHGRRLAGAVGAEQAADGAARAPRS